MSRKWNVTQEVGTEREQQVDVPIFSNRDGKFSSGIYGVDKVIYLTKSSTWLIITRFFKVFVRSDDMQETWETIDEAIFNERLMAIQVNRLQWSLAVSEESTSYRLRQTDKCEIYEAEVVADDELEAQAPNPKLKRRTAQLRNTQA